MRKFVLIGIAALLLGSAPAAMAAGTAAYDPGTASGLCQAYFGVASGPEPLSACQWDMRTIHVGAESRALATGSGVKVGVIDGGVDMTHPDLVANLDVALSCSFIFDSVRLPQIRVRSPMATARTRLPCRIFKVMAPHVATTIAAPLNGIGIDRCRT